MFFEDPQEIETIAIKNGAAIFVLPNHIEINIKNALIIKPEGKSVITIEQIRQIIQRLSTKQLNHQFIILRPADTMNDEAANAFLKNLEEPKEKVHFILITDSPSKILPTILSRAAIYILKNPWSLKSEITAGEKPKQLAKALITAKGPKLLNLVEEINKKKPNARVYALQILEIAIEMLYKTYFITNKSIYLDKTTQFLATYDAISRNGHVKLQLVANLC